MRLGIRHKIGVKSNSQCRRTRAEMSYRIAYSVARQIADHAQSHYPDEVCGLIAGQDNHISYAVAMRNIAEGAQHAYSIDANEQLQALKAIDDADLSWIGVYHSHPNSPPLPSAEDQTKVSDYGLLHMIVSLRGSKPAFKLWQFHPRGANRLDLQFDSDLTSDVADPPLTRQQKIAVLIAGAFAVLLLLGISLSLLPPAPDLTSIR